MAGAGLTLFVGILPFVHFAHDEPNLHLALEVAEGGIAGVLAYLAAKRYRATGRLQDAVLAWAFSVFAFVNLFLSAGPLVSEHERPGGWLTWATLGARFAGVTAVCAGALAGARAAPPWTRLRWALLATTVGTVAGVGLAASAAGAWLAAPVDLSVSPGSRVTPWVVGHPVVLAVQVLALGLYSVAAVSFTRQAQERDDQLLRWLGAGAALGAFARVNYFLFPSLYSSFVYTGDLLRFGSYLCFLVGAAREVDRYWQDQACLAAMQERRRLARDLHDGLPQELAFIRSQTVALAEGMTYPGMTQHLADAAERALAESRRAVDALAGDPADADPLPSALVRAAEEVATRAGAVVKLEAETSPVVPPTVHQALTRVTREACNNAVRHGAATTLLLRLSDSDGHLHLTIADNGTGFDVETVQRGYGLRSMRERVEALGGELQVTSEERQGTIVGVDLPASETDV
ncbi:MAG: sensor histidine kinase [Acidimicrobiales bacterium]